MRWPFFLILGLFAGLCCAFNVATPYRKPGILLHQFDPVTHMPASVIDVGAPDERQHANYVDYLMTHNKFPVLVPGSPSLGENYQSHQPPLYYMLDLVVCKFGIIDPTLPQNGFLPRFLNTIIGGLTLCGVFWLAKWSGFDEPVALGATAFVGLIPMSIGLHASISNDPLLYCLCTWSLAFTVKGLSELGKGVDVALAGLFFGLAVLTKTTGLALAPMLIFAALLDTKRRGAKQGMQWGGALLFGMLVMAPWIWHNMAVYHEPFATKVFTASFVGNPMAEGLIGEVGPFAYWSNWVGWWTARSFVGTFSYNDIFLFEQLGLSKSGSIYTLILAIFALMVVGTWLAPRLGKPSESVAPKPGATLWVPALTLLLVVVALFVGFNRTYFQGQARYVYPAIAVLGLIVAQGLAAWFKDSRRHAWIVLLVLMLALDIVAYNQITTGFAARTLGQGAS